MKKSLAIIVSMFMALPSFADNSVPPDYLKDAVITVKLKSGKEYTYSANEYMVVKRGQSKPAVQPVAHNEVSKPSDKEAKDKNIVSVEGIYGTTGIHMNRTGTTYEMSEKKGLGLGLQYQRELNEKHSVYGGIRVDTNGNAGLSVGKGF